MLLGKEYKAVLVLSRMFHSETIPGLERHPNCSRSRSNFCIGNKMVTRIIIYLDVLTQRSHLSVPLVSGKLSGKRFILLMKNQAGRIHI